MSTIRFSRPWKAIASFFSDDSLTKKAYLNTIAAMLDYLSKLVVGFFLTPLMVNGLGDYFYGAWQVLNRLIGYISPTSGRPAQALRWTLANKQSSTDYQQKREYVGSTLMVWLVFLPLIIVLGGVVSWYAPVWINSPVAYYPILRLASGILVVNMIMTSLATLPHSVLQGENMGYKRMGLSTFLVFAGGGLTWLSLLFNTGIAGVAGAALISTILSGLFFFLVVKNYSPWFGVAIPSFKAAREFVGLSGWFVAWNLVMMMMNSSDVVLLGLLDAVERVTDYTLTKYAADTVISMVAIIVFGIAPGLGGIIGAGDYARAARVRGEIMSITWLIITAVGATILLWNRSFVSLWSGPEHYVGAFPTLLIVIVVSQFVVLRNDSNVIDVSLKLRNKVLLGLFSATLSIIIAAVLVEFYNLGVVGISLGLIIGRFILSISYPVMVGRYLQIPLSNQIKALARPLLVMAVLFFACYQAEQARPAVLTATNWLALAFGAGLTGLVALVTAYFVGLSRNQQNNLIRRVRAVFKTSPQRT